MTASVNTHAPKQDEGTERSAAGTPAAKNNNNSRRWRAGVTSVLTLAAVAGGTLLAGSPAGATTVEVKALGIAASKHGDPYAYGAAGPNRFDCSGLTSYAFKKAGRYLPRTAQAQYNWAIKISKANVRPGDLVFFHSGRSVYHVGIYAGGGKVWHAPHTGSVVKLEKIWTSSVYYGRV
jgi:cell wall-associated NlpC family hydrolase